MRYRDIILARALGKGKRGMAVGWPLMLGVAGGGGTETTVTGVSPLLLAAALHKPLKSLTQYGLCTQADTPTPAAPVDIMCNNGTLKMVHQSGLPSGYKLLEYVGGTGSQYVITDLYLASTDVIECEFRNSTTTGYGAVYGIFKNGESSALYGNQTYYGYDQSNNKVDTDVYVDTDWHASRHDFVNGTLTIDDTTVTFTPFEFVNSTKNAVLSRYYNNNYGYNWKGYVRKFKVTRNGEVVCDLLPAKDSNDVAGLYDLVSGSFYTATGGTLVEGNEVNDYELAVVGTDEVIYLYGKNLDGDNLDHIGFTSTGGASTSETFVGTGRILPCNAGEKYTISFGGFTTSGISGIFVNTWKTDGTFNLRQAISSSGTTTYQIPAGVNRVNFTLYKTGGATIDAGAWMQVEYGASATDYVPYVAPQTASAVDLFGVGDYADTQDIISGEITRKIGIKVLDGTENISVSNACFTLPIADRMTSKTALLCSHFPYSSKTSSQTDDETIISFSSTNIGFRYDACADKTAFAAWLKAQYAQGTPVVVLYPLATEATETATPQALTTNAGDNTIIVTANVSPIQLDAVYMKGETA